MEIITNIVTSELSCNRSMNSFLNSAEFIQCKYGDETVCIIRMKIPEFTTSAGKKFCLDAKLLQQLLPRITCWSGYLVTTTTIMTLPRKPLKTRRIKLLKKQPGILLFLQELCCIERNKK